jgi:formylglycine-generating enzyme required for sulfatase activity
MGSEKGGDSEKPLHKVTLSEYQIARAPITNAQYALYVQDVGVKKPQHWKDGKIPARLENHPVVYVSWDDAMAYCKWLGEKINKNIILPSEAQWEKAARGSPRLSGKGWGDEVREYPWGDEWKELHCNSEELGLKTTTPVGLFRNGASPYGMLDMSGNTWEWCLDWYDKNEYKVRAGKEIKDPCGMESGTYRVVRGGSWFSNFGLARASYRSANSPDDRDGNYGFRVIVRPLSL